jgi:hypothetical protein
MAGTRKVAAARRRKYDDVFIEQGAVRHGMVEDLAPFTRRAPLTPSSYDETAQTVEAVISTGAPVRRRDHIERLDLSDVEPATLIGLPVLDGHRQATSANVVGVIAEARREGTALVAIIRLSQADDAANIRTKIAEGVLRGVSLGYGAIATRESVENGQRVRTIVRVSGKSVLSQSRPIRPRKSGARKWKTTSSKCRRSRRTRFARSPRP